MSGLKHKKIIPFLGSYIGGLFYALGFPVEFLPSIPVAPIIGVFIFFTSLFNQVNFKERFLHFLCFSLGAYTLGYYWIPYTIKEFGSIGFPFNQILGVSFSLIVFPHFFILVLCLPLLKKIQSLKKISHISIPLIAFIITVIEHITPTQFPTYLAHPFGHMAPYLGMAPIFGTSIFSFMSFWIILSLIPRPLPRKKIIISGLSFFIFILCNLLSPLKSSDQPTNHLKIRMVQANIGNFMKLNSEEGDLNSITKVLSRYREMSLSDDSKVDLIIWPETAYPRTLYSKYLYTDNRYIPELFKEIIINQQADLFIGGYDYDRLDDQSVYETEYNAALFFKYQPENQTTFGGAYHKIILLAFGETLPFGYFNKFLSKFISNISYFKRGDHYSLFKTKNNSYFISSICYEILQPSFTRKYLNSVESQPHFIINLTNDSWYGISSEPYQHLFLSKWRAYEFQIPIIRMTNTGISSIIYPDGSESKRTKLSSVEKLDLEFTYSDRRPTVYQKYGELPFLLLWLVLITSLGLFHFVTNKNLLK